MLDFGQVANLAMGVNRLHWQRNQSPPGAAERVPGTALREQAELHGEAQKLDAQKMRQTAAIKGSDEIDKIVEHRLWPRIALSRFSCSGPRRRCSSKGLNVKIPMPDDDELMGGYESMDRLIKTIREGAGRADDGGDGCVHLESEIASAKSSTT